MLSNNTENKILDPKVNLLVIGAMKSGTTSVHEYLNEHPLISMSNEKEPGFFVEQMTWSRGFDWYHELFPTGKDFSYYGESSTHYTKFPEFSGVAKRIYEYNPNVRLIYTMRNPFKRLVSHYWHQVRAHHSGGEVNDIDVAIQRNSNYLDFSNYALQLEQYYELFPKEQIYILTFEELVTAPGQVTKDICQWLGLNTDVELSNIEEAFNAAPDQMTGASGKGLLNKIQHSKTWNILSPLVPSFLKNAAKSSAYKPIDKSVQADKINKIQQELLEHFRSQTQDLKRLTGREFPEWPEYNK